MKSFNLAIAVSLASILIGCGSSNDTPKVTGELRETDVNKTLVLLNKGLEPETIFENFENMAIEDRVQNRIKINKRAIAGNGVINCTDGGTREIKEDGEWYWESNKSSGVVKSFSIEKNCKEGNITTNGTWVDNIKWKKEGNTTLIIDFESSTQGTYRKELDKKHYIEYTKTIKGTQTIKNTQPWQSSIHKTKNLDAKVVLGDEYIELKKLVKNIDVVESHGDDYNFTRKETINGFAKTNYINGFVKIETEIPLETNQDDIVNEDNSGMSEYCEHKGLVNIRDKQNNILSTQYLSNHNIVIKYNNKEFARYNDCTEIE